jgi:hypothetical protein
MNESRRDIRDMPFTPSTIPRLVIALIVWPVLTFLFFAMAQVLFDPTSVGSGIRGPLAFFYYLSLIGVPAYFLVGYFHHRRKTAARGQTPTNFDKSS